MPGLAGMSTQYNTFDAALFWGGRKELRIGGTIVSTAADAGNTPTTTLRKGLVLGKVSASGKYKEYDPDGTDGSQIAVGILGETVNTLDPLGAARDSSVPGGIIIGGEILAGSLLLLDAQARRQLSAGGKILFDDDVLSQPTWLGVPFTDKQVTGNVTLTAADNGKCMVCHTADATITLPTLAAGLCFSFLRASDHETVIASAEGDNIIVGNDLSADSVTFTTAGQQIGVSGRIRSVYVGTTLKWHFEYNIPALGTGVTGGVALAIAT